jgi:hypothetical protein
MRKSLKVSYKLKDWLIDWDLAAFQLHHGNRATEMFGF